MRTYGRIFALNADGSRKSPQPAGYPIWKVVQTDPSGDNSAVWITTLLQCLQLNLNESPFYANYGIAAKQAVASQIAPNFDVARTQQQFSPHFASLIIVKRTTPVPTYDVHVITFQGAKVSATVPQ
jgi:hypothetical protein